MVKFLTVILIIILGSVNFFWNSLVEKIGPLVKPEAPKKEISLYQNQNNSEVKATELPLAHLSLENIEPTMANIMSTLLASASQGASPNFLPIRDWSVEEPPIEAKAALILMVDSLESSELNQDKILYQKNIGEVLPIASLTKLMTASIILENMDLEQVATVSQKAVSAYGEMGNLSVGEKISVKNLLYALLLESSNDAAVALAENFNSGTAPASAGTASEFVSLMNQKAKELGLKNTAFTDPTGFETTNISTALNLAKLVKHTLKQPLIYEILRTPSIDLASADGLINHHFTNTNQLLSRLPNIVGGKTGYTEEANSCMILVTKSPKGDYLISIVLGAQDKFQETEKLVRWAEEAYLW